MRDGFLKSLTMLAQRDKNIVLLTADLGYGVFELFEEKFPGQYFNVGVAEQNMTGLASGLALEGKTVFTYSIGNFPTLRCLEQIRNDACYHNLNINIVSSGGGFSYGALGMSHHTTEDISILRSLPGITVIAPCNEYEAEQATLELAKTSGVGYLRIDKSSGGKDLTPDNFHIGCANLLKDGSDVSFIVAGGIMSEVIEASEILELSGVSTRVISMHTVKPLDTEAVDECVRRTKMLVTVEENNILGGLGGAIAEYCLESGAIPELFIRIGLKDLYSSVVGDQQYLRRYYGMDAKAIVRTVLSKKFLFEG